MKAKDVKIGMRVRITGKIAAGFYGNCEIGTVLTIVDGEFASTGNFLAKGFKNYPSDEGWINCRNFEPYIFTKSDLKTGMRVVYRNGKTRVFGVNQFYNDAGGHGFYLSAYEDALIRKSGFLDCDIMKVYAAPEKCEDFFNLDVRGELLFKREEKTEKQIQAEKLMAKADKLKAEFEALVKQATDLAGE